MPLILSTINSLLSQTNMSFLVVLLWFVIQTYPTCIRPAFNGYGYTVFNKFKPGTDTITTILTRNANYTNKSRGKLTSRHLRSQLAFRDERSADRCYVVRRCQDVTRQTDILLCIPLPSFLFSRALSPSLCICYSGVTESLINIRTVGWPV